ncbi:MAG: DUF262 domain-containing HNH endonuclease family protein [Bacteroidales bacterium]|nr:DUF262 domain-containing HNH endonuclease family protein [Bacteroidales bacterium]
MSVKNIEPKLRLIGEYALNKSDRFVIPSYQRGYSWTTDNCAKLWDDIQTFRSTASEDPYFFGTIIIDCSTPGELNLIDGQQRTTTFLLLMKALQLRLDETLKRIVRSEETKGITRGLEKSQDLVYQILYRTDDDNLDEILKDWNKAKGVTILETHSINEIFKTDFVAIIEAKDKDEAERNVVKIPRRVKDNKYSNFYKNFKFFYEELAKLNESELNSFARTFLSQCQIIEIRSWQLEQAVTMFNSLNSTGMPLSDADIISAQLYSNAEDREAFIKVWRTINSKAERLAQANILDIDGVLQEYMFIRRAQKEEKDVKTPGVRNFYINQEKELLSNPLELASDFEKILDIWEQIRNYPVVKVLMKFNENFKLFLIPYLFRFTPEDITEAIVNPIGEALLRLFTLVETGETPYSSAKFKSFLYAINIKLVDPNISIDEIIADFDAHINNPEKGWNSEAVAEEIKDYRKNILVFLNEYLYAREKGLPFNFADSVNIEHIMPASGKDIENIRQDAGIETKEEFNGLVNLLGNKILLEDDINRSVSNDWFKTKKGTSIKSKRGYQDSSYGIASALADYPKDKWEKEDIEKANALATSRITNFIFHQ